MRQQLFDSIDDRDNFRSGLPLNVQDDRRNLVHPGGLPGVLGVIEDSGNIGQMDWGAVLVCDDERSVIATGEQLVVCSNLIRLMRSIEVSFGLIDVGGDDGGTQILKIETVRSHRRGIRLNPDSGLLSASYADQTDTWQLRNLRRKPGVGEILNLRERQVGRSQGKRQDRGIGWIGLAVDRSKALNKLGPDGVLGQGIAPLDALGVLRMQMEQIRERHGLGNKEIAFKDFGMGQVRRALPDFLHAAVRRSANSGACHSDSSREAASTDFCAWGSGSVQR